MAGSFYWPLLQEISTDTWTTTSPVGPPSMQRNTWAIFSEDSSRSSTDLHEFLWTFTGLLKSWRIFANLHESSLATYQFGVDPRDSLESDFVDQIASVCKVFSSRILKTLQLHRISMRVCRPIGAASNHRLEGHLLRVSCVFSRMCGNRWLNSRQLANFWTVF